MYRYIYKITCTAGSMAGKYYYGQHTTDNIDDGYKGSGKILLKYYKKYPFDFIKEILSFHDSYDELNKAEYDIIHDALNDPMCINVTEGGGRLPDSVIARAAESYTGYKHSKETREKMSKRWQERIEYYHSRGQKVPHKKGYKATDETRKKDSEASKRIWATRPRKPKVDKRKFKTDEERSAFLSKQLTERNTGRLWMNDGNNEVFVTREAVSEYTSNGYVIGRIYHTTGVKFSEESKAKISKANSGRFVGAKWLHNDDGKTAFIVPSKIQEYLDKGWKLGRI